jgi:predicted alpha/beta-hydrolase family hydrolase
MTSAPDLLHIQLGSGGSVSALRYTPTDRRAEATVILAHGAGGGQRSPFLVATARAMAESGIDAITFNFPYTEQGRRAPDRAPVLERCYVAVILEVRRRLQSAAHALFIGGKSMGGRMATHVAAADPSIAISGLMLFGYPLHPPGKPQQLRDAHLPAIHTPMLIVQGGRDPFGTPAELRPVLARVPASATLHAIDGGDHSFKVTGGAARQRVVDDEVRRTAAEWMLRIARGGGMADGTLT